jgi:hypothetical protein
MDKEQVEQFFAQHKIAYAFNTREMERYSVPAVPWSDPKAAGRYGAVVRGVRSWIIVDEHAKLWAEIDTSGAVTQVYVESAYSGI